MPCRRSTLDTERSVRGMPHRLTTSTSCLRCAATSTSSCCCSAAPSASSACACCCSDSAAGDSADDDGSGGGGGGGGCGGVTVLAHEGGVSALSHVQEATVYLSSFTMDHGLHPHAAVCGMHHMVCAVNITRAVRSYPAM